MDTKTSAQVRREARRVMLGLTEAMAVYGASLRLAVPAIRAIVAGKRR